MNSEDDPEARIRALEQPLSAQARASELGGASAGNAAYLPPPTSAYGSPPPYGAQPYGNQPFDVTFNAPPKVTSGMPWLVFGIVAAFLVVGVSIGAFVWMHTKSAMDRAGVSSGGGSIDIQIPSFPSVPAVPSIPATDPDVLIGAPGQSLSVAGVEQHKTITCNDATVTVSGVRNTVAIDGHCAGVTVSGMNNVVTIDSADAIGASGFDNRVTYQTGSPQIDFTGSNVVEQG
ncbi:DUF3060 domain-containing protein [Mycobacterium sp. 1274761.0]|uniref:DUF3060 domain-containing protein n=1 Tax=Mycobacterium sp. 1274761.0 TaxID=1834077 RepID=UPI0009EDDDF7|nr:DUF3060 domain-containing protein [Mycobacterium sp. 1274761.0]